MAVTGKLYYPWLQHALLGESNLAGTTAANIRVLLCTTDYAYNQTHTHVSHVTNEISGTGYTAGGQTLTTPAVTNATGTTKFSADNAQWTTATISAYKAVIYSRLGADSASWPLIGYLDFGETMSSSAGTFTIAWSTAGILTITTD